MQGWFGDGAAQEGDGQHGAGQDQCAWRPRQVRQLLGFDQIVDQSVRYGVAADCHLAVNCSLAVFRTLVVPHAARCEKIIYESYNKTVGHPGCSPRISTRTQQSSWPRQSILARQSLSSLHRNFTLSLSRLLQFLVLRKSGSYGAPTAGWV